MGLFDSLFKRKVSNSQQDYKQKNLPAASIPVQQIQPYRISDRIAGQYEIYRILGGEGKSGMGVVYICYDHVAENVYALKTFQNKYLQDKRIRDRFKKEAFAWTHLEQHPHIVRAEWVQELDYRLFVGAEFIAPDEQGRNTLTKYLKSPITIKQALTWGIQFCYGMEHACAKGVSPHRDIKPDNIMITHDGRVKITDFGLAGLWEGAEADQKLAGERENLTFLRNERGKVICGTRPYMAPEQFEGVADVRSDMYSFGIVLYQLVNNGKLPIYPKGGDSWEKAHKKYPIPVCITEEKAHARLAEVIGRCLAKEAESRYGDFREVREEIERIYEREIGEKAPTLPDKIELNAAGYTIKGVSLANLGLIDEAIGEYREALRINPGDAEAHSKLGSALAKKNLLDEAIKEFHEALRINPGDAEAHTNLGSALAKKNLLDEAIGEYREALRINPGDAEAHYNLGSALKDKGLLDEAIAEYREALRINPGDAEAHYNLGSALKDKGLLDEAIGAYHEALRINPGYAEAHINMGIALYNKGLLDEAIESFDYFLKYAPPGYADHVQKVKQFIKELKDKK